MKVTTVKASQSIINRTVNRSIKVLGDKCNLNFIDTESVTDMSFMFDSSKFNGDISNWNVEKVTSMKYMFNCSFIIKNFDIIVILIDFFNYIFYF